MKFKVTTATTVKALVLMIALPGATEETSAQGTGTSGVPVAVLISGQLGNQKEAAALCILAVPADPTKIFCYYDLGGAKRRDDDVRFTGFLLKSKIDGAHERWIKNAGLETPLGDSVAAIDDIARNFIGDRYSLQETFVSRADESLQTIHVDVRSLPQALAPKTTELAIFAHRRAFEAAHQPSPAEDENGHEIYIEELQGRNDELSLKLAQTEDELKIIKENLRTAEESITVDQPAPQSPWFLSRNAVALAAIILLIVVLFIVRWHEEARRRVGSTEGIAEENGVGAPADSGVALESLDARTVIFNSLAELRNVAGNMKNVKQKKIIFENCQNITTALTQMRDSYNLERSVDLAEKRLQECLLAEDVEAMSLPTMVNHVGVKFADIRGRLLRLIGSSDKSKNINGLFESVENHVRDLAVKSGDGGFSAPTLLDLKETWRLSNERYWELRQTLAWLNDVPETADPSQDLEAIRAATLNLKGELNEAARIKRLFVTLQPGEDLLAIAQHSLGTYRVARQLGGFSSQDADATPRLLGDLFERIGQLGRDHHLCSDFSPPIDVLNRASDRFLELGEQQRRLAEKIEDLGKAQGELDAIGRLLDLPGEGQASAFRQVELVTGDRNRAFDLLHSYGKHADNSLENRARAVLSRIEHADETMRRAAKTMCRTLNEEEDLLQDVRAVDEVALRLVERHADLRKASQLGEELCLCFSRYLDLPWRDFTRSAEVRRYIDNLKAEIESPQRPLRLGLAFTRMAWQRAHAALRSRPDGHSLVVSLRLAAVHKGLSQLLERLANLPPDELWVKGLRPGFSKSWLHDLFRAELLIKNFYPQSAEIQDLADAVALASATLRLAMAQLGKGIEKVRLLQPLPPDLPPGWDSRFLADEDLRRLPEVNRRVLQQLEEHDHFVVDVERFRLTGDNEHSGECRVVVVNPAEWRQSQQEA